MTPAAKTIIADIARECGLEPYQFIDARSRRPKFVRARIKVAKRLRAIGYSASRIGAVIGREHSTVLFYLGGLARKPKPEHRRLISGAESCTCHFIGAGTHHVDGCKQGRIQ